ncbi:hypothetical protein BGW80DRAFT_1391099 [Lactifluus volemus]|nr:hypothetical protein BGW80DRAFT_1391099 [Lactifluus volemus]
MTPASLTELKEIWNQYMRTSLSGSGQPTAAHEHHPAGLHESWASRVSRCLLLELPVGVIACMARTAVSCSHRAMPG